MRTTPITQMESQAELESLPELRDTKLLAQRLKYKAQPRSKRYQRINNSKNEIRDITSSDLTAKYPKNKWIHACTDGSAKNRPANKNGGSGEHSYTHAIWKNYRKISTNYKAELEAIKEKLKVMEGVTADQSGAKVVILNDSKYVL
ncbi:hypothetical protein ElyMa_000347300 [Elysia marginata]|uniref:RNase H type-1 domain-containing protein n=1 Tax=Elysia marginata TaxID=1093978 RepID=A0AAV4FET9_9GAST|nr:hypothetical protein ElyMa_000347300 [Elysia marginata]